MRRNPLLDRAAAMDRASIPEQHHGPPHMSKQMLEEGADIQSREIAGAEREIERQPFPFGREGQRTDRRDAILFVQVADDRRLPFRGSGPGHVGNKQEAGFIEENEMSPMSCGVFYMRPADPPPLREGGLVPLQGAALGFLATPPQPVQQPPNMAGVIANVKPLPNHLCHALQGPQIGPVPRGQGARHQHPGQPLLLRLGELGWAAWGRCGTKSCATPPLVGLVPSKHRTLGGPDRPGHGRQ